ncbi:hypothetical protein CV770_33630 [Bradyrhizobium sp. AC87j1]|nr:hypothetical protein CV770_33630 [Bradyrhizobium sp. AC87j1]
MPTDTCGQGAKTNLDRSSDLAEDFRASPPAAMPLRALPDHFEEVVQQRVDSGRIAKSERPLRVAQPRQINVANHLVAAGLWITLLMLRP